MNPAAGVPAALRRIMNRAVDREGMLRYLFDGRGEPVASLLPGGPSSVTRPRLQRLDGRLPRVELTFDREDKFAARIAARVKAVWEQLGVPVPLQGSEPAEFRERTRRGDFTAVLLLHHPPTADPVLGLHGSLAAVASLFPDAIEALEEATGPTHPGARLEAARRAEAALLRDARLIPLVRLHAWLASDPRLVGVTAGAAGILHLDGAWLVP